MREGGKSALLYRKFGAVSGGREKVNPGREKGKAEGEWEQFLPFSTSVKIRSSLTGLKVESQGIPMPSSEFRALTAQL